MGNLSGGATTDGLLYRIFIGQDGQMRQVACQKDAYRSLEGQA